MLALPIALLLALPAGDAVATEGRTAQDPSVPPQTLIPYGSAQGSWVAGTLHDDGILVALLEDAAGRPVFVMDARLSPSGHIDGVLRPLEYATNPVLGLPSLHVDGQARISAEGDGPFEAMIATPLEGAIPVHPFGRIEGVLLPGVRRAEPGQHPSAALSDGAGQTAEIEPQDGAAVIVCPAESQLELAGSASAGQTSAVDGSVSGGSSSEEQGRLADAGARRIVDPLAGGASDVEQGAAGARRETEPGVPPSGEGRVRARWYLLP